MTKNLVLTLTGHDKIGIVDHVTEMVLQCNGNIEGSRMARLGGEFAMMMLVAVPEDRIERLQQHITSLKEEGYVVNAVETDPGDPQKYSGWIPFYVKMAGADHEGVVHEITHHLAECGINIESLETSVVKAPMSGTPLFSISAIVLVPPKISLHELEEGLKRVGDELNMDSEVTPYVG